MIPDFKIIFKFLIYTWLILTMSLVFNSCDETIDADNSRFGYDFFPLETGGYQIYNVSDISYSPGISPDTNYYQLKVLVTDSLVDNAGETSFSLQRLKRINTEEPWQLDSVWTAYRNDVIATVLENNIPVIKLVFPFKEGKSWDSNSLNSRNSDNFQMREVFKPYSYPTELSDYLNSITIIQEEKLDSIISLDYRYEIYAQSAGLVKKIRSKLEFCQDDACLGQKIIEEGEVYSQVLIEYGTE